MKRNFRKPQLLMVLSLVMSGSAFSQANTALSNLTATSVNTDLIPSASNTRSIGSSSKSWKDLYLGNLLYVGGAKFLTATSSTSLNNTGLGVSALVANTNGYSNTALGASTLHANTTGFNNVAIGYGSLFFSKTGHNNVAVGALSLYKNTVGVSNAAIGNNTLNNNTSGSNNMALGANALQYNTEGNANIAIGNRSMLYNTVLSYNVAVGDSTLYSQNDGFGQNVAVGSKAMLANYSGGNNSALGYQAMYSSQSGGNNVSVGAFSMYYNNSGSFNVAVGEQALYHNTTGVDNTVMGTAAMQNSSTASYNIAIGFQALSANSVGNYNVGIGVDALYDNRGSVAKYNTAVGYAAIAHTTNSQFNTAIGYQAGAAHDMGYNNTILGANCDVNADGLYNCIAIGQQVVCTASSQARIGNAATTSIGGYTNWTNISDGRFKKNIRTNVIGLEFIQKLRPVTYNLDVSALNKKLNVNLKNTEPNPMNDRATADKEKMIWSGFVAQEVDKAAKDAGYDFSGVDKPETEDGLYGLRYAEFVVPLVKAVQQLSDSNSRKNARIDSLSAQVAALNQKLNELADFVRGRNSGALLHGGYLDQNTPNPVKSSTTITYSLPQGYSRAKVQITDMSGRVLQTIPVSGSGKGTLTVNTDSLSAGTYPYALYVDGAIIGTKQMLVVK